MPFEISWHIEGRVIYKQFHGTVTLDEIRESYLQMNDLVKSGTPPVHVIANLVDVEKYPTNIFAIHSALADTDDSLLGWRAVISSNTAIGFIVAMVSQLRRSRYRMFVSDSEGLAFLTKTDPGLADYMDSCSTKS